MLLATQGNIPNVQVNTSLALPSEVSSMIRKFEDKLSLSLNPSQKLLAPKVLKQMREDIIDGLPADQAKKLEASLKKASNYAKAQKSKLSKALLPSMVKATQDGEMTVNAVPVINRNGKVIGQDFKFRIPTEAARRQEYKDRVAELEAKIAALEEEKAKKFAPSVETIEAIDKEIAEVKGES